MNYIAIDGDRIGERLEAYLLRNDLEGARNLSSLVENAVRDMRELLECQGCVVVFATGDGLFAHTEREIDVERLPLTGPAVTFSVGISTTASEALLALKLAKGLGRNRVQKR